MAKLRKMLDSEKWIVQTQYDKEKDEKIPQLKRITRDDIDEDINEQDINEQGMLILYISIQSINSYMYTFIRMLYARFKIKD